MNKKACAVLYQGNFLHKRIFALLVIYPNRVLLLRDTLKFCYSHLNLIINASLDMITGRLEPALVND